MSDDQTREALRSLPSIDLLLAHPKMTPLLERHPRVAVAEAARAVVAQARQAILDGRRAEAAVEDLVQQVAQVPTLAAATLSAQQIGRRARRLRRLLRARLGDAAEVWIEDSGSQVGGGALPTQYLPTRVVALRAGGMSMEELARRMRLSEPAVVGRIQRDALLLDLRTVRDGEIPQVADVAARAVME
jgi:hypothetical protein